jgi:hypothetical protein
MTSWANLFDRSGHLLDEFDGTFQRSWGINAVGECKFTLPVRALKNTNQNFRFKNWLVVFNNEGLPPWVGRLETPRGWGNKTNKHKALSAESVFANRIGTYTLPYGLVQPAGVIFRRLINIANDAEDTLIHPGKIFGEGGRCGTFISPATLLSENIAQILKQSGHEYEIEAQVVNNQLTLLGNWYDRMGETVDGGLNDRNCGIDEESLSEVGPIYNVVLGLGKGDQLKTHHLAINQNSIDEYGRNETRVDVDSEAAEGVLALTEQELARLAWPHKMYRATATNKNGTYALLRKGNVLAFENSDAAYGAQGRIGTQEQVRIYGMAANDDVQGVALTIIEE